MVSRLDPARTLERMSFKRALTVQRALIREQNPIRVAEICGVDPTHIAALDCVLRALLAGIDAATILRLPPWHDPDFQDDREEFCRAYEKIFERASRIRLDRDPGFFARIRPWVHPLGLELRNASHLAEMCETLIRRQDQHITITAYDHAREAEDVIAEVCRRFGFQKNKAAVVIAEGAVARPATMVRLKGPGTPANPNRATNYLYCAMVAAIQIRGMALLWSGIPLQSASDPAKKVDAH